jgi:CubicO group peptidase (beta-lactamase class C family)
MLLPPIVAATTGRRFFDYARDEFFNPLGINTWQWHSDAAGNPLAMATLGLNASSLARIGRLLLDGGRIGADHLLAPGWVKRCRQPVLADTPSCGLGLFWRWPTDDRTGPPCCFGHDGSGGQHLWCYPDTNTVIARLRDNHHPGSGYQPSTPDQEFRTLPQLGGVL